MIRARLWLLVACHLSLVALPIPSVAQTLPLVRTTGAEPQSTVCDPARNRCATLYLDGAVRSADKKSETTAATGSIGVNLSRGRWELVTQINLAASMDTIRQSPGQSMLVPGSGGFRNGLLEGRVRIGTSGVLARGYYSLSSYTWALPPMTATDSALPVPMNILGSGGGLVWRLANGDIGGLPNARLLVELNAGVMNRTLRGDVIDGDYSARRSKFLGSPRLSYTGFEWGMTLGYNDLRGSIAYYTFPHARGVQGFTRGQAVAGFAIAAPIVQGELR